LYDYHSKVNLLRWVVNLVDEAHHFLSTRILNYIL
jgi:hypothetical protein